MIFVADWSIVSFLFNVLSDIRSDQGGMAPSAPVSKAIFYQPMQWDHTNIYFRNGSVNPARKHKGFGPPSAETETAWNELLRCRLLHENRL